MGFKPRLSVIAGKLETVPGTEQALTGADASAVIADPQVDENVEQIERDFLSADFSRFASLQGKKDRRIKFRSELKGSGTAGTPPAITAFLRACGMSVANVVATSDTYTPNSGLNTITMGRWLQDGAGGSIVKKIKGAMGSFSLEGSVGAPMFVLFDFLGQWLDVVDLASPTGIVLDVAKPPQLLNVAFTIGGFTPKISKITINGGQVVTMADDISTLGVHGKTVADLTDRDVQISFDAELTTVAAHDWYGKFRDGVEAALSFQVGSVPGNRYTVTCPAVQYLGLTEGERDNIAIINFTGRADRGPAGDDELSILFN